MKKEEIQRIKRFNKKENLGITLVALVVTIVVLIIIAGISINMILSNNGLLNKTNQAKEEHQKQTATEIMNLKITNIQISSYTENQQLPNLQYVSDKLCEDNDMEYVILKEKEQASLEKITVGSTDSILTKLKAYPYVFEINNQLQLASIDGIKVAKLPENDEDSIVTMTKSELQELINISINNSLKDYSKTSEISENYATKDELNNIEINSNNAQIYTSTFTNKSVTANVSNTLGSIKLSPGKYVLVGFAYYQGNDLRYHLTLGGTSFSAYDNLGYVGMNVTDIVNPKVETTYNFYLWPSKSVTLSNGYIKAIKIAD